jgi:hypothetical protein
METMELCTLHGKNALSLSVGLCSSVVVLHGNVRTEEKESTGRVSFIVLWTSSMVSYSIVHGALHCCSLCTC